MKTSLLIITAVFVNTSILLSEYLSVISQLVSIWWFVGLEIILIIAYVGMRILTDARQAFTLDINDLDLFASKQRDH